MPAESQAGNGERMRLQKFLARAGAASRRKCEEFIAAGRVSVNGEVVTEMGVTIDPASDVVELDGVRQKIDGERVVIMLNKPAGYLTAMRDARERTVAELVPAGDFKGLFPIGRLDKDTTGLLLFTTDGELGHALLHPSRKVAKRYVADIRGVLDASDIEALEGGMMLDDGMTAPALCEVLSADTRRSRSKVALTIHEGRKRQVRRMFKALGHDVVRLHRESFGPLDLGDIPEGAWRVLSEEEIALLER